MTYGSMSLIEELICLVVMFIYIEKKKKLPTARNVLPWKILERLQPASLHDDPI